MGLFGFGKSDNLYFPGCYSSAFLDGKIENYKKILKKLDIDFKVEKDIVCCGGFLEEAGYDKQLRKIVRENKTEFESKETKRIITNCPLCYNTLKNYKNLIPNWNIETDFIINLVWDKIKNDKDFIRRFSNEPIVYYDSCYLARYDEITEQPRELLKQIGYQLVELPKNREETICCGSCGGLMQTNPELANKIAFDFIKILKRRKIKKIVTADPRVYKHLKAHLLLLGISEEEIELLEFSEVLCEALGIER